MKNNFTYCLGIKKAKIVKQSKGKFTGDKERNFKFIYKLFTFIYLKFKFIYKILKI